MSISLILFLTMVSSLNAENDAQFILETSSLPADLNFMPSLANGHLGFTVYGDAIYMNGVYNGYKGNSRRARLPNWMNITAKLYQSQTNVSLRADNVTYTMNLFNGYFQWLENFSSYGLTMKQRLYAHRFYNRALVYEMTINRLVANDTLTIAFKCNPGADTKAFDLKPENLDTNDIYMIEATTKEIENEIFQLNRSRIYVAFSDNLRKESMHRELKKGQYNLQYRFVITADKDKQVALAEMRDVLAASEKELLEKHSTSWQTFWENFHIDIKGDLELSQIVNAGIFFLASSLPSLASNNAKDDFYGLSPTGLSRGQLDDDYEGHNFWDTEIWMLPVVTPFNSFWSQELFNYRLKHIAGAMYNANITGFQGARFPWESAFTGTEATNPCCPEVATQEIHISADIAVALQQFYATIYPEHWLCETAWPLVREIALFISSRTEHNKQTDQYHIKNVMGPDEDHQNVNDNVYTNVISKEALQFASYTQGQCSPEWNQSALDWLEQSKKMFILYDTERDYHPQHEGYKSGEEVKQADTILLGYPLQFDMANSTRFNDLSMYENVTRHSGPAMTWSMFAINFLDIGLKDKANKYFYKAYKEYVRPEFKVWSETKIGFQGSANFLTGIGGFLQSIISGYAGIRFHLHNGTAQMLIRNVAPLPGTSEVLIKGIKFANSTFSLNLNSNGKHTLTCLQLGSHNLELFAEHVTPTKLFSGFTIQFKTELLKIQTL